MSGEQFSLVWNSFPRNLSSGLYTLLTDEQLVDVTLAAEGQILRAHKLILSVCSTYFRELFKGNSCRHPIVILKDVNYRDLSAMLHFMYQGEVNIKQEDIASFLKVAETLQIKGLTTENENLEESISKDAQNPDGSCDMEGGETDSVKADDQIGIPSLQATEQEKLSHALNMSPDSATEQCSFLGQNTVVQDVSRRQDNVASISRRSLYESQRSAGSENDKEEPLDCSSSIERIQKPKREPLDYTLNLETRAQGYKSYALDGSAQKQGLSNAVTALQDEFAYYGSNYGKGRRTVKGIPSSSLPLETTLRVVSELGPTLRMERGKVIRMYSCPWCLRHFTRKENLKLHVRYIHGPLESLTCKLCGNKYKNSNSLRVHSYLYHNAKRDKHNKPRASDAV